MIWKRFREMLVFTNSFIRATVVSADFQQEKVSPSHNSYRKCHYSYVLREAGWAIESLFRTMHRPKSQEGFGGLAEIRPCTSYPIGQLEVFLGRSPPLTASGHDRLFHRCFPPHGRSDEFCLLHLVLGDERGTAFSAVRNDQLNVSNSKVSQHHIGAPHFDSTAEETNAGREKGTAQSLVRPPPPPPLRERCSVVLQPCPHAHRRSPMLVDRSPQRNDGWASLVSTITAQPPDEL